MIFGIGTDIVSHARIQAVHERYGDRFAHRILSPQELPEYFKHTQPSRLLLKRFAAKEALSKAVGHGLRSPITFQRISISHDHLGKPIFVFDATLAAYLRQLGITQHHLSISDERDMAIAFVVLESTESGTAQ